MQTTVKLLEKERESGSVMKRRLCMQVCTMRKAPSRREEALVSSHFFQSACKVGCVLCETSHMVSRTHTQHTHAQAY